MRSSVLGQKNGDFTTMGRRPISAGENEKGEEKIVIEIKTQRWWAIKEESGDDERTIAGFERLKHSIESSGGEKRNWGREN